MAFIWFLLILNSAYAESFDDYLSNKRKVMSQRTSKIHGRELISKTDRQAMIKAARTKAAVPESKEKIPDSLFYDSSGKIKSLSKDDMERVKAMGVPTTPGGSVATAKSPIAAPSNNYKKKNSVISPSNRGEPQKTSIEVDRSKVPTEMIFPGRK